MKVLLVDDERLARTRLTRLLKETTGVEIVGEATSGAEALEKVATLKPDVVFLDIEMPGLSGLEVAAALPADGPRIVFATAYDEFAVQAFEANAFDYLVKPVETERLAKTMERLARATKSPSSDALATLLARFASQGRLARLAVRIGAKFVVLDLAGTSAFSTSDHYVEIVFGGKRVLADDSLDALEARLDPAQFLRIHRSAIINLAFLKEMRREGDRKYTAVLADYYETELPISREALPRLKEKLGIS